MFILKAAGLEMEDPRWMHLHRGHGTATDAPEVTFYIQIYGRDVYETLDSAQSGVQVRYMVRGVPVSTWLDPPFRFALSINNPALAGVPDGFSDISLEIQGIEPRNFKPQPAFLHMTRDHGLVSPIVPIIAGEGQEDTGGIREWGPGVVYVNPANRSLAGHPANPNVSPWQRPPFDEDLYLELMAPHTELWTSAQMWWEDPPHPGVPFARGFPPQHCEDHRELRVDCGHQRFPAKDGPRGVGWMSPYISGQVDSRGRFAFAEVSGRVGWLHPDGRIQTIAGWVVRPGREPIWITKPLATIRGNMENRGDWREGRGEFFTPLDVAVDPTNEDILYVVGYEDHCVWKVDARSDPAVITVFAGDRNHQPGFQDGQGHNARLNGPASLVFDPVRDVLYVADQDNDAIRRITRGGTVTTLFGSPGMLERVMAAIAGRPEVRFYCNPPPPDGFCQFANRAVSRFEVPTNPDVYLPQTIRVFSNGDIALLELGFGAIRRIHPGTGQTRKWGEVRQMFEPSYRGWAWFDVDRWGNAGPRDSLYWCKFVGQEIDGEPPAAPGWPDHFNEVYAWLPPEGGLSQWVFGMPLIMYPDGWGRRWETNPPHYPWLVAVDPRGALLVAGGGEHGLCRLRRRRSDDPIPTDYLNRFEAGRNHWASGGPDGYSPSFGLKFGWGAHNYLGLADAWQLRGSESDEQVLDLFEAPAALRDDPRSRELWLEFVRLSGGSPGNASPDLYGDLNRDLVVNAGDFVILANYLVGNLPQGTAPFTAPLAKADLNRDSLVNAVDSNVLANYLAGNIPRLPV